MLLLASPSAIRPDYAAAAHLVTDLPDLMAQARAVAGITAKTQAAQVGITTTTLTRLEAGSNPTKDTIVQCLRWLAKEGA